MSTEQPLVFAEEISESPVCRKRTIKVLTVDDDPDFQKSTRFAIARLKILGHPVELLQANNYFAAARILSETRDIAIMLVDVVMETDRAGLRLVKSVRELLGNEEVRIVLVTGQPGIAPVDDVMANYDINDYWIKSELSATRLKSILTANWRSYEQLRATMAAKRGLQLIVESGNLIYAARNTQELADKVLDQLSRILHVPREGIVCVRSEPENHSPLYENQVITASGKFVGCNNCSLDDIGQPDIIATIETCLEQRNNVSSPEHTCLFFPDEMAGADYAIYLATGRDLEPTEIELLRVFSMNVCSGFQNVSLISQLDRLAYEDELLKIPNRNFLLRSLKQVLHSGFKQEYTLQLLDIDNFSGFNASLGAIWGDALLEEVSSRLRKCFDQSVLVARIKDDQFAALGRTDVVAKGQIDSLFVAMFGDTEHPVTVNLSSVSFPLRLATDSALEVLTRAGIELKTARRKGISQHVIYSSDNDLRNTRQFQLLQELHKALQQHSLQIVLQPQLDIATGRLTGFESLARWKLDSGMPVSPLEFIPLAETSGLIMELGEQIFTQSCRAAKLLEQGGLKHFRIGINLSALQFEASDLAPRLLKIIKDTGIKPSLIEVEVTESAAMSNFENVCGQLNHLRSMGVRVAIDDFGTGFSSLAQLHLLPADRLKIDKAFVDQLDDRVDESPIIDTIIRLGESFHMNILAEGVERIDQSKMLLDKGCHEAQGYYFSKPLSLDQTLAWAKNQPTVDGSLALSHS